MSRKNTYWITLSHASGERAEYWYDRSRAAKCWWAARYDRAGNQLGDKVHAVTQRGA